MAVYSIIKLSELEGAKRIDPEFYHPEKIISKKALDKVGIRRIKDCFYNVRQIFDPQKHNLNDTAYVFDLSDIKSFFLSDGKIALSSEDVGSAKKMFSKNDVLISRLRPYLKEVSFVGFNGKAKLASTEFIVLRQKDKDYYPEVLFSFLISHHVQNILLWSIAGTEHPRFHDSYLLNLKLPNIPIEFQNKIKELVKEAWKFFLTSQSLYSQAENLLLEELGLKDFKPRYQKTYTAKLSDAFSAHRIDAEYFQPAYEEVVEGLKKRIKVEKLKNVVSFINHGKQPYYVENGDIPVLIQKHLGSQLLSSYSEIINMPDTPKTDRNFIKNYPEYLIKPFDVLFYSVGAYLGRTNVVLENFEAVPASFITLIRTKKEICNPIYLALFLNSEIGQLQSTKWKSASAQQYIYPKEIREFVIPILPLSTQQKIASLVQESYKARKKAKELLEAAKRAVEIAIEKNEEEALKYISKTVWN